MDIIQSNWWEYFSSDLKNTRSLRIISPFVTENLVKLLLDNWKGDSIQLITRFNLNDFQSGVSSLDALKKLVSENFEIKGIKELHSKVYIFDDQSVIITSANFTNGGFFTNYEFGVKSKNPIKVSESIGYFEKLWTLDSFILNKETVNQWEDAIEQSRTVYTQPLLHDYGISIKNKVIGSKRYFVKFYGQNHVRADLSKRVIDEVTESHCHFAVTFSEESGVPKRYNDGDVVYMARMLEGRDYAIFGRAIAKKHIRGVDEASNEDIDMVIWKEDFPIYIRVHSAEFLNTDFNNCPKLKSLMKELDYDSFRSTKRRYIDGERNINPANVLMRKPDVTLSDDGALWLDNKFNDAKQNLGLIPQNYLDGLYQGTAKI